MWESIVVARIRASTRCGYIIVYSLHVGFCCCLSTFFKIILFKKFFQEHYQGVKRFGSRSGQMSVGPDLGPNCLQRLSDSADYKSRRYICSKERVILFNSAMGDLLV